MAGPAVDGPLQKLMEWQAVWHPSRWAHGVVGSVARSAHDSSAVLKIPRLKCCPIACIATTKGMTSSWGIRARFWGEPSKERAWQGSGLCREIGLQRSSFSWLRGGKPMIDSMESPLRRSLALETWSTVHGRAWHGVNWIRSGLAERRAGRWLLLAPAAWLRNAGMAW